MPRLRGEIQKQKSMSPHLHTCIHCGTRFDLKAEHYFCPVCHKMKREVDKFAIFHINWYMLKQNTPLFAAALRKYLEEEWQPESKLMYKNEPLNDFLKKHGYSPLDFSESINAIEEKLKSQKQQS